MAEHDSKSERGISKMQWRVTVGYCPKGGDLDMPQLNITGKWLVQQQLELELAKKRIIEMLA